MQWVCYQHLGMKKFKISDISDIKKDLIEKIGLFSFIYP